MFRKSEKQLKEHPYLQPQTHSSVFCVYIIFKFYITKTYISVIFFCGAGGCNLGFVHAELYPQLSGLLFYFLF